MPFPSLPGRWLVAGAQAPTAQERQRAALLQIDAWDPVAGATVTQYASSHDDADVCHSNGQTWWPMLGKLPVLRYDLFDGSFEGQITAPSSNLSMQTEAWPNFPRYSFPDARIRMWTGYPDSLGGSWTLRFDGRISEQPKIANGVADLSFAVDDKWLDGPLLETYAGTTGAEGPAEMKGQVKPLALGTPRYVPGKLIDSVNSVFQVSAYGGVQEFEVAFDKLIRFPAPIADYPTYAALVAATIPAGQWATAKAVGMARLGAPPLGLVCFHIKGDIGGPSGWARAPGQLIRRLALLSGGAGKIHDASLNALDALRPCNLCLYLDQQTTARQLIQTIAASVNAVAGVSWTGKLFLVPVGLGAPTVTLAADGSALPAVATVEQIAIAAPWRKIAISAERTWAVHATSDIAFTAPVLELGPFDIGKTYREGNIVEALDKSRWLYISTTPSAGHDPLTSPSYWFRLSSGSITLFNTPSPPTAKAIDDLWTNSATGQISRWDGSAWVLISDITSANQIKVEMVTAVTVPANYLGVVDPGQFSIFQTPTVRRGATDIRKLDSSVYALAASGMTAAVDNANGSATKGTVEITALNANTSYFDLTATIDGVAQPAIRVTYSKAIAAPPPTPGGGGGGGGSGAKSVSDSTLDVISTTSFAALTDVMTVTLATGERLVGTAPLDYDVRGNGGVDRTMTAKWQYSPAGAGTWTDFASAITGTPAYAAVLAAGEYYGAEPGHGNFNQSKSGLAAGNYDVRLVGMLDAAGRNVAASGTATIEAKV